MWVHSKYRRLSSISILESKELIYLIRSLEMPSLLSHLCGTYFLWSLCLSSHLGWRRWAFATPSFSVLFFPLCLLVFLFRWYFGAKRLESWRQRDISILRDCSHCQGISIRFKPTPLALESCYETQPLSLLVPYHLYQGVFDLAGHKLYFIIIIFAHWERTVQSPTRLSFIQSPRHSTVNSALDIGH